MKNEGNAVLEELRSQLMAGPEGLYDLTRLWLAAGHPRGKSPFVWSTRQGLKPGVKATGRPRDPFWADRGTAQDYAHYLDRRVEADRINRSQLVKRGWTDTMIREFLPECDATMTNPNHQSGPPIRLYLISRVVEIEATDEFRAVQERSQRRREASARAVETKKAKVRERLDKINFTVPVIEWDTLVEKSCQHYNEFNKGLDLKAAPDSETEFLHRIMVNYLRHVATPYDEYLNSFSGITGKNLAYEQINEKFYGTVVEIYPELGEECDRQMRRKDDNAAHSYRRS